MKTEYVTTVTDDGLELQGLIYLPERGSTRKAVLHIHGLAGNFYWNRFLQPIAKHLTQRNVALLAVNTRGHDTFADFHCHAKKKSKIVEIGAALEIFRDSRRDIEAWVKYLTTKRKFENVIIEGHSTGALKGAYFVAHNKSTKGGNVVGLALISPSDDIGLQRQYLGDAKYRRALSLAKRMVSRGRGEDLMPDWASENYVSAQTYFDAYKEHSDVAIFQFHDPNYDYPLLSRIKVPVLVVFGSTQEAIVNDNVKAAIETIRSYAQNAQSVEGLVVNGATHSYLGHEDALAKAITGWTVSVMGNQNRRSSQ